MSQPLPSTSSQIQTREPLDKHANMDVSDDLLDTLHQEAEKASAPESFKLFLEKIATEIERSRRDNAKLNGTIHNLKLQRSHASDLAAQAIKNYDGLEELHKETLKELKKEEQKVVELKERLALGPGQYQPQDLQEQQGLEEPPEQQDGSSELSNIRAQLANTTRDLENAKRLCATHENRVLQFAKGRLTHEKMLVEQLRQIRELEKEKTQLQTDLANAKKDTEIHKEQCQQLLRHINAMSRPNLNHSPLGMQSPTSQPPSLQQQQQQQPPPIHMPMAPSRPPQQPYPPTSLPYAPATRPHLGNRFDSTRR